MLRIVTTAASFSPRKPLNWTRHWLPKMSLRQRFVMGRHTMIRARVLKATRTEPGLSLGFVCPELTTGINNTGDIFTMHSNALTDVFVTPTARCLKGGNEQLDRFR